MKTRTTLAATVGALALVASGASASLADDSGGQARQSADRPTHAAKVVVGKVTVTPSSGLKNLQTVTVKVSSFGKYSGTVSVAQCTTAVLAGISPAQACDVKKSHVTRGKISKGKGTLKFKVRVGSSFSPGSSLQKCRKGGTCVVTVSTATDPVKYAGFAKVSFKG